MPTLIVVGTLVLAAVTASAVQFAKERSVILPVFLLAVVTPLAAGSVDDRS
ncbi:MAG TPA: hypothetical protein VE175_05080 [Woeseiaceae bacterium]|nr:hypothetical protein [Woeseiaceae bacterium]